MKKIILGALFAVASVPSFILGSSYINSLIAGKTTPEAVTILAEQTDILVDKVDTVASTTAEVVKKQDVIIVKQVETDNKQIEINAEQNLLNIRQAELDAQAVALAKIQADLAIKQAEADARALALETQALKVANDVAQIKAQPVPVPVVVPAPIRLLGISSNLEGLPHWDFPLNSSRVKLFEFRLTADGNTEINISSFRIAKINSETLSSIWIESIDGTILVSKINPDTIRDNKGNFELKSNFIIPANTHKDLIIFADIKPSVVRANRDFQPILEAIKSTSNSITGLPVVLPSVTIVE